MCKVGRLYGKDSFHKFESRGKQHDKLRGRAGGAVSLKRTANGKAHWSSSTQATPSRLSRGTEKEEHGSLDDQTIRTVYERLQYLRNLDTRKAEVRELIEGTGKFDARN